jgi:hypothetical protein
MIPLSFSQEKRLTLYNAIMAMLFILQQCHFVMITVTGYHDKRMLSLKHYHVIMITYFLHENFKH